MSSSQSNLGLGLLLLLGAVGVGVGIVTMAIILNRRAATTSQEPRELPEALFIRADPRQPQVTMALPVEEPHAIFENEQTVKFIRGSDRLLEEIIVHRKVIQYGR